MDEGEAGLCQSPDPDQGIVSSDEVHDFDINPQGELDYDELVEGETTIQVN